MEIQCLVSHHMYVYGFVHVQRVFFNLSQLSIRKHMQNEFKLNLKQKVKKQQQKNKQFLQSGLGWVFCVCVFFGFF